MPGMDAAVGSREVLRPPFLFYLSSPRTGSLPCRPAPEKGETVVPGRGPEGRESHRFFRSPVGLLVSLDSSMSGGPPDGDEVALGDKSLRDPDDSYCHLLIWSGGIAHRS